MSEKLSRTHHVFGGGTFSHVRSHMALAAPAFGETAISIHTRLYGAGEDVVLHLTKMADPRGSKLVTNEDVSAKIDELIADPSTGIIFMNVAMCDFDGTIGSVASGKYAERLQSRGEPPVMHLTAADKVIGRIRKTRKDIFLVAFKTTTGKTQDEQYEAALKLLKDNSANLVLANDTATRMNMIVAPEETRYGVTSNRSEAITMLVKMALSRAKGHYTRSTVVNGDRVDWNAPEVPANLRAVVNHCIERGAYKPFNGKTAGHFAVKVNDTTFLTSARKENFNFLAEKGLVRVEANGDHEVIAFGAKPSVGGQSQRIVFKQHPKLDCIVHFHCPMKETSKVNVRPQWPHECGSHECGQNTADGLRSDDGEIYAVMLDEHGPNIVFSRHTPAEKVIAFIEDNFDLTGKTGGVFKPSAAIGAVA